MLAIAIAMIVLMSGLIASLLYTYRLKKQWRSERRELEAAIGTREAAAATITLQYQALTENTKELFVEPVTQLPTYKVFFEQLQRSMVESKRYSFYLALCLVEINNKQAFVDEDIEAKELFLAECAQHLRVAVRKIDFLAHYEGNTFALLLTGLNKPEKAALVAQRIFDVLARSTATPYATWNKTVSIGISIFPTDGETEKEFLAHTLHALAIAKQKGRSAYQFYEPALQTQSQREHSLVSAMNGAKFFDQLHLVYHPVVDIAHKKILSLSAELQWQHPQLGLIPQSEYLSWAEKQNRLIGMMVWQLEQACHYFLEQRKQGSVVELLMVAIPLALLRNSRFIHGLQQWLLKWEFSPEWLCLQVHGDFNSIPLEDFEKAANMLHYLNIQLIIEQQNDQSLPYSYFMQIPFTYYKLSDKMLGSMLDSSRVRTVLHAISQFMNQLSIQLIVSDVGIQAKRDVMQQLGVTLIERKTEVEAVS